MNKKFELLPPMMPNYARLKVDGLRQEGFKVDEAYPIKNFTEKEAEEYGELMKQSFIKHWKSKQD
jgi:predicted nucleic acid-binding protein